MPGTLSKTGSIPPRSCTRCFERPSKTVIARLPQGQGPGLLPSASPDRAVAALVGAADEVLRHLDDRQAAGQAAHHAGRIHPRRIPLYLTGRAAACLATRRPVRRSMPSSAPRKGFRSPLPHRHGARGIRLRRLHRASKAAIHAGAIQPTKFIGQVILTRRCVAQGASRPPPQALSRPARARRSWCSRPRPARRRPRSRSRGRAGTRDPRRERPGRAGRCAARPGPAG